MTIPADYYPVSDKNYLIKNGDKIHTGCCGWREFDERWLGNTKLYVLEDTGCAIVTIYTKDKPKPIRPRFKQTKPFPWGW